MKIRHRVNTNPIKYEEKEVNRVRIVLSDGKEFLIYESNENELIVNKIDDSLSIIPYYSNEVKIK